MSTNMFVNIIEFILVLGLLIFAHEFGHYIVARLFKIEVEEFGFGFPPRAKKLFTFQGTDFTLNWIPFGAFVRPKGENDPDVPGGLANAKPHVKLAVLLGGPLMNLLVGFILFTILFVRVGSPDTKVVQIQGVVDNSPAALAGIQTGDVVLRVNSQDITSMDQLHNLIQDNKGKEITLMLDRAGESIALTTTPRVDPPEGQGPLGISMGNPFKPITIWQSMPMAASATFEQGRQTFLLPIKLIRGQLPAEQARVVGPVGIFNIYNEANNRDQQAQSQPNGLPAVSVLLFVSYISVALGVTNLLPIPALDGGRIIFVLPELIFRKRIPARYENFVNMIGFTALLLFMAFITIQDVINPIQLP